jgi:AcrR family transcriptional regulator
MSTSEPSEISEISDVPRVLRQLWGLEQPPSRGPKRGLSLQAIAQAGVRVADADGLDAVSMSRVASDLGFSTMALYRYVDSKDDLLLAMANAAFGLPELPRRDPRTGWRTRMEDWTHASRAVLMRHTWLLQLPVSEPPLAPNPLAWMEAGLQALSGTRLHEQEKLSVMLLTDVYVRGQTQLALQVQAATDESGSPPQQADQRYVRVLSQLVRPQTHPRIMAAMTSGSLEDGGDDFGDAEFAFGLKTVLDGIASLITSRDRGRSQAAKHPEGPCP